MPNVKLDSTFVLTAHCPAGKPKVDYYDTSITGFILEVRANGGRTYALRYRDAHGRQRQLKIGNAADLSFDKARKEAMKAKSRAVVGENPAEERKAKRMVPTIQELSVRYMDYVKAYKRSWINDDRALRNHILPKFGKLRLDELQQDDVAVWLKGKLDEGRAMASVNFLHVILGCMYRHAKRWKLPGSEINPIAGIPHFQANNARERYLTADEAERLRIAVEASENKQLKYIVSLLLLTGARKTELLQARWVDIDIDRRAWRVPLAKSGKARQIPLSKAALDVIGGWLSVPDSEPRDHEAIPGYPPVVGCGAASGRARGRSNA